MLNTEMSASTLFLSLDLRLPPWLKGIDRLRIIPAGAPSKSSEAMTADDAIARLTQARLACGKAQGQRLHILGGTSIIVDRDIRGYENAFAILAEPDGRFLVLVSGVGRHHDDEETTVETLAEAVDAVISLYRSRGVLGP